MQDKNIVKVTRTLISEAPILAWADTRTDPSSSRRHDLIRDKTRVVSEFFSVCGKSPEHLKYQLLQFNLPGKRILVAPETTTPPAKASSVR
jgi:hypothetical protein